MKGYNMTEEIKKKALEICQFINNAKSECEDNKNLHDLFEDAFIKLDEIENDLYEKLVDNK